jgi:hypothetical protein
MLVLNSVSFGNRTGPNPNPRDLMDNYVIPTMRSVALKVISGTGDLISLDFRRRDVNQFDIYPRSVVPFMVLNSKTLKNISKPGY